MKILVQFNPSSLNSSVTDQWRREGKAFGRWEDEVRMMVYRAEEVDQNIFSIPPELADPTLHKTIFIEEEEIGNQIVCRRDGKVRKASTYSLGRCEDNGPSATFWGRRHLALVELDREEGEKDDYIYITWKLATVITLDDNVDVHVFDSVLWEGYASEYEPSVTPRGDFTEAIKALQERVACLKAKGANCAGPHYADTAHVENMEETISQNTERRSDLRRTA